MAAILLQAAGAAVEHWVFSMAGHSDMPHSSNTATTCDASSSADRVSFSR